METNPPWRYKIILGLAWLPVFILSLWQSVTHKEKRFILQRFGLSFPEFPQCIWLHAASVGEVIAAAPLISQLKLKHAQTPLLLTTVTPTGAETLFKRFENVHHAYLPLDRLAYVKKFLAKSNPVCALIMETELWPNLYSECHRRDIPILSINARLSQRTLLTPAWVRHIYGFTVRKISAVLARSEEDAINYVKLGANPKTTHCIGNIKFAATAQLNHGENPLQRPYVLAASTHDNEEEKLVRAWLKEDRRHLLVIAPRHPKRSESIQKQIRKITTKLSVRSQHEVVTEETLIYLADTLGELSTFMTYAELVFMGGSLVPVGGHNILEPAALSKAIVYGPHMENFAEEHALFQEKLAACQVQNEQELMEKIEELLQSQARRQTLGDRAYLLVQQQQQVLDRYMQQISHYCPGLRQHS